MCSNCEGKYEGEEFEQRPEQGPDFEQEPDFDQELHEQQLDMRSSGYIARHDPDAMDQYIADDHSKLIITNVCKAAGVEPPNPIAMGHAIELIRGLTAFNAEQMCVKSLTSKGLDITLLRRRRQEFEQAA